MVFKGLYLYTVALQNLDLALASISFVTAHRMI